MNHYTHNFQSSLLAKYLQSLTHLHKPPSYVYYSSRDGDFTWQFYLKWWNYSQVDGILNHACKHNRSCSLNELYICYLSASPSIHKTSSDRIQDLSQHHWQCHSQFYLWKRIRHWGSNARSIFLHCTCSEYTWRWKRRKHVHRGLDKHCCTIVIMQTSYSLMHAYFPYTDTHTDTQTHMHAHTHIYTQLEALLLYINTAH